MKPDTQLAEENQPKIASSGGERVCVPELVERQWHTRPNAIAVAAGDATLTYAQLHRLSNQLAQHLRSLGVGPETLVGIYMDRSAASVIASLACFKALGAYLPLDPSLPAERLAFMLSDANLVAVISTAELARNLSRASWPVVVYDPTAPEWSAGSDEIPQGAGGVTTMSPA